MKAIAAATKVAAQAALKQFGGFPASMGADRGWRPLNAYGAPGSPARVANAIKTYGGTEDSSATVFACTTVVADTMAMYDWDVTDEQGDPLEPTSVDQDLFDLLEEPAPETTYFDWAADVETDIELVGNSYWLKEDQNGLGQPRYLERFQPGDVKVATDKRDRKIGYVVTVKGVQIAFGLDDIVHYRTRNPLHRHYGMGTVEALLRQLDLDISVQTHLHSFFTNGARIAGVLTVAEEMDDKQFERLKAQVQEQYGGPHNAYRTLIAEKASDFKPVQHPPAALGIVDLANLSEDKILKGFGVPAFMLGGREEGGVPKMAQSQFIFYRRMLPRARRFQERTTLSLVGLWEGRKFVLNPELDEPPSQRIENARKLKDVWAAPNESRTAAGLPEIDEDWADQPVPPAGVQIAQPRAVAPPLPGAQPGSPPPEGPASEDEDDPEGDQRRRGRPRYRNRRSRRRKGASALPLPPGRRVPGIDEQVASILAGRPVGELEVGDQPDVPDATLMVEAPPLPDGYEQRAPLIDPGDVPAGVAQALLEGQARFFVRSTPRMRLAFADFFNEQRSRVLERLREHRSGTPRAARANPEKKELEDGDDLWDIDAEDAALVAMYYVLLDELGPEAIRPSQQITNQTIGWDLDDPAVQEAREALAELVVRINETTRKAIREQVEEGMRRGMSIPQIANGDADQQYKGIQGVFNEASAARAETIARTETAMFFGAANAASYEQAHVAEVAIFDGNGDPECAEADGSVWPLQKYKENLIEHPNCVRVGAPVVPGGDGG